jgi:2-hydroxychromene-2-carboxylate isomerase
VSTAPKVTRVDFHFDILCPFSYMASKWIREVRAANGLEVTWRFFSLEEVNLEEGKRHPWERRWSYGWSMLRIAALLRRRSNELVDAWYLAAGRLLHEYGEKPHDPAVAAELLRQLDLDPGLVEASMEDPALDDEIRADHERVLALGGFGVPTLVFEDGQAFYGPVLIDPPTGKEALRLFELVTIAHEFPNFFELQRPKGPAQQAEIKRALEPYLAGRDWRSIDRGKEVRLD